MSLQVGEKIQIVEIERDGAVVEEVIDEAVVTLLGSKTVAVRSLKLHPEHTTEFGICTDENGNGYYRMLSEDPFTGRRSFSQRSPKYRFQQVS